MIPIYDLASMPELSDEHDEDVLKGSVVFDGIEMTHEQALEAVGLLAERNAFGYVLDEQDRMINDAIDLVEDALKMSRGFLDKIVAGKMPKNRKPMVWKYIEALQRIGQALTVEFVPREDEQDG